VLDKRGNEIPIHMLDSVEAKSGGAMTEGRKDPRSPIEEIRAYFRVAMVDISTHWASYA